MGARSSCSSNDSVECKTEEKEEEKDIGCAKPAVIECVKSNVSVSSWYTCHILDTLTLACCFLKAAQHMLMQLFLHVYVPRCRFFVLQFKRIIS